MKLLDRSIQILQFLAPLVIAVAACDMPPVVDRSNSQPEVLAVLFQYF